MADEIRFAPKDAKIIKDNPGKSPYELKELGLSDPAFDKLMAQDSTAKKVIADEELAQSPGPEAGPQSPANASGNLPAQSNIPPAGPEQSGAGTPPAPEDTKAADEDPKRKLIPKLESPSQVGILPKHKSPKGQVWVQTPAGKRNLMGETFARKLVKQDPRYKII